MGWSSGRVSLSISIWGGWWVCAIDEGREPFLDFPTGLEDDDLVTNVGSPALSSRVGDTGSMEEGDVRRESESCGGVGELEESRPGSDFE